jgi:SPOR domain
MRTAFFVLLFANVAFFAYRFYVTQHARPATDPIAQQIQPERVRIVPPGELARLAASRRGVACIELGPIAAADAARAEEAAGALAGGLQISQRRVDDTSRWWVYIPPLPTRAAANQRVAELKKQGVDDFEFISDDSPWRNAISLGVFSSEDAANRRIEELKRRGVRGAQAAPREGRGTRIYVQLRDAPEPVRLRFVDLKDGFPGADVRECPGS